MITYCSACGEKSTGLIVIHKRSCREFDPQFYSAEEVDAIRERMARAHEEARKAAIDRGVTEDPRITEWKKSRGQ